jgi:hypothetical protein
MSAGWHPARLHIVSEGPRPIVTYDLSPSRVSSLAATGVVVVFWMLPREGTFLEPHDGTPRLVAFDTGSPVHQVWQFDVQGGCAGAPVLGARERFALAARLYYHDPAGHVYAYRVQTRPSVEPSLRWSAEVPAMAGALTAMGAGCVALGRHAETGDDILYVPCGGADGEESAIVAFDALTGNQRWSTTLAGETISTAANLGPDGTLYFGTRGGRLYAVDTESSGLSPDAEWPAFRGDGRNTGRARALVPTPTLTPAGCPRAPICTPGPELTPTPGPTPTCPPCRKR